MKPLCTMVFAVLALFATTQCAHTPTISGAVLALKDLEAASVDIITAYKIVEQDKNLKKIKDLLPYVRKNVDDAIANVKSKQYKAARTSIVEALKVIEQIGDLIRKDDALKIAATDIAEAAQHLLDAAKDLGIKTPVLGGAYESCSSRCHHECGSVQQISCMAHCVSGCPPHCCGCADGSDSCSHGCSSCSDLPADGGKDCKQPDLNKHDKHKHHKHHGRKENG